LAEHTALIPDQTESFSWNFALLAGALVSGTAVSPDGALLGGREVRFEPISLTNPDVDIFFTTTDDQTGTFEIVVPLDIYWAKVNPPSPYYGVPRAIDLSSGDVTGVVLRTTNELSDPYPKRPPDRSKISVGDINEIGEALVTGAASAVDPLVNVLIINLDSLHQGQTVSASDGSFSTRVFAPPGSALLIKHGAVPLERWMELDVGVSFQFSPFPGTIIELPQTHSTSSTGVPFSVVGPVEYLIDFKAETTNWVNAAWVLTGTLLPAGPLMPGDSIEITGTARVYSPAIDATTNLQELTLIVDLSLLQLFDEKGRAVGPTRFMSSRLTPTGFPIQGDPPAMRNLEVSVVLDNLSFAGSHSVSAPFFLEAQLPTDLAVGLHRPVVTVSAPGFPDYTQWLAAEVYETTLAPFQKLLPPIIVGDGQMPRLLCRLLLDHPVQGIRGAGALEDTGSFGFSHRIATQGSPYIVPRTDHRTGRPITYRLEPYLPRISFTDRRIPSRPLLPFALPSGELTVVLEGPGGVQTLGSFPYAQSLVVTQPIRGGDDLNPGTVQMNDIYSLTTNRHAFEVAFAHDGPHIVLMNGSLQDIWGNDYLSQGSFEVWVAELLDIDPGVLPGVPFAVGDAFNPTIRLSPGVPADVDITVTLLPDSDPHAAVVQTITGSANHFGTFSSDGPPITFDSPGEYRVDLVARYTTEHDELFMGAMTWGGVVMTPVGEAELSAHGRRGLDSLVSIPASWFVSSRDLTIPAGAVSHLFNPYYNGDLLWSRINEQAWGGDSLVLAATLQDLVGTTATDIQDRLLRMKLEPVLPGTLSERVQSGELPVFSSTTSGLSPLIPSIDLDQISYSYLSSQRPGVRVREIVGSETIMPDYWRLDTQYDNQLGVGFLGDQANDFKFQYVGVVFRDVASGHNEYLGQGSGWIFIPDDDALGTRAMPPFAGQGNGGWTTDGGPILTLNDTTIDMFILPTGTRPGAVLEVGEPFVFAGHLMPTLASEVAVTLTAPSGATYDLGGQANRVGYYYDPTEDVVLDEPGAWAVDVRVWHDGLCSGGATISPYPEGDVLGSDDGRYWVYVIEPENPRLEILAPQPGYLSIAGTIPTIEIETRIPRSFADPSLAYTISMPGYILEQGETEPVDDSLTVEYDPVTLQHTYPNLDLSGKDDRGPGLADTISIGLLLCDGDTSADCRANTMTIQGQQVFVGGNGKGFTVLGELRHPSHRSVP